MKLQQELQTAIKDVIEYTLKEEKLFIDNEVSVIFIDNEEIREINLKYRGIDEVTDVLIISYVKLP